MRSSLFRALPLAACAFVAPLAACGPADEDVTDEAAGQCTVKNDDDIFAATEACAEDPKADTGYVTSLDAREAELTLEADVVASSYSLQRAPLEVGQFALTWLRENKDVYIASLAEDYANGDAQIEWKVGTAWKTWSAMSSTDRSSAKHFRLTRINAVFLNATANGGVTQGKTLTATVPVEPSTLMSKVGAKCANEGHITASTDTYWYVWAPEKSGCTAQVQQAKLTVTKLLPKGSTVYPEYNKLFADKKFDAIVFFGQVDDGALKDTDLAFSLIRNFERTLTAASFKKVTAPKGLRYQRVKLGITATVDIYSPREFGGLGDYANVQNFYDGVNSHELVVFNGHSMLGASDFWANAQIYRNPTNYQVFLYNGCLGYEYYVAPILNGKKDPANVDVVSNIVETPFAIMVQETATAISLMLAKAEKGGTSSWQTILTKMNGIASGDSFYGVSAARTNTYKPTR